MPALIPISNYRRVISQLCGALPYYCLAITFGTSAGYLANLLNTLSKENAEIVMSLDQLSWFASLSLISPLASMITALITHQFGNRIGALLTATMFSASSLLAYYSFDATTILASGVLSMLTDGGYLSASYISEMSEPQYRGSLLAIFSLSGAFGHFLGLSLANTVYWRHIALVNLTFPVFAAVLLLVTPSNSPAWLAREGRLDEAEQALCWLRGWARPGHVQVELGALVENAHKSKSKHLENPMITRLDQLRRFIPQFLRPSFYSPFATISLVFFIYYFGGTIALPSYSLVIFRKMHSPIPEAISSASVGAIMVVGALTTLTFVRRVGKRKLALFSAVVAALSHTTVATIGFLELKGDYLWISPIALIITMLGNASGITPVSFMLNSEIFPASIRYIGMTIAASVGMIMMAIVNKIFLYVVDAITLPGTFLLFAALNVVAVIVYYHAFLETEGKSLIEIENHYNGVKRLDKSEKCYSSFADNSFPYNGKGSSFPENRCVQTYTL